MTPSQRDEFDRIADAITADPSCAMLLLQEGAGQATWRRARDLIDGLTGGAVAAEVLRDTRPAVVLFRLAPADLREAVLRLTANGFVRLKAIDARVAEPGPSGPQRKPDADG